MPRVVQLSPADIPAQANQPRTRLRELGYVEGHNIRLEFLNAAGNVDALSGLAQELVGEGDLDVIVAISSPAALAAFKAPQTIPIAAFAAVDPVASGLANSLASPGRNVTGVAVFSEETTVKRVELMREVAPHAVRLGTVATKISRGPQSLAPVLETGRKLGFTVKSINVDEPADLAKSLSPEVLNDFDVLVFVPDVVLSAHMAEVMGFMSFGPDYSDANLHLASQLDRVLKGTKPGDLPFERPTKFDLRINLRIARRLGIELPPTVLARADEVIE